MQRQGAKRGAAMTKWLRTSRQLRYFARLGIAVYLNETGDVCFKREAGPCADPVIIISVPKSGTYLFGELLTALGIPSADVHVATYGFQDLRFVSKEFAVAHSREIFEMVPSDRVLPLILPGQHVVSHFPFEAATLAQIERFKKIFTYRNVRDTLVSTMRWVARKGKLAGSPEGWESLPDTPAKMEQFLERHGGEYLWGVKCMREWANQPGVLSLSFEQLLGDFGEAKQRQAVQRIGELLHLPITENTIDEALKKCLNKETLTFSGKRSSRDDLWSVKVEKFFTDYGADELDAFWKSRT
jgi:hypothetical protein